MPIHLTQNPYQGINAHFQSFLQSPIGGWTTFHSAYPYSIAITSLYLGKVSQYGFHLEDKMPVLAIPLLGEDSFLLDFGAAYQTTFENDRRAHLLIDYEQLPLNFESYMPLDQQKIRAVMARIATTKNP